MKILIMQPYFMPYLGYWQMINAVDKFVILDDVNFIKKGWIHKNNILINDKSKAITISIKKVSQNKLINELELSDERNWRRKMLRTIEHAYSKSPYYTDSIDILKNIIFYKDNNLINFLKNSILAIMDYLDINTQIIMSSNLDPNKILNGEDRILKICKLESALTYINPIGGIELYNRNKFYENNISLKYHKIDNIVYNQFSNNFIELLSIIDVLMFNNKDVIKQHLDRYTLI